MIILKTKVSTYRIYWIDDHMIAQRPENKILVRDQRSLALGLNGLLRNIIYISHLKFSMQTFGMQTANWLSISMILSKAVLTNDRFQQEEESVYINIDFTFFFNICFNYICLQLLSWSIHFLYTNILYYAFSIRKPIKNLSTQQYSWKQ